MSFTPETAPPADMRGTRFGMFVHWGHSSQRGCELSWPMVGGTPALPRCLPLTVEEYQATAATFNPAAYDPGEWAQVARRLGMEYAILTAKHHDGYAMFHTQHSAFSVQRSPYGRDIVAQFVEAMRGAGLRVGLYFSLIDWHHPDYPAFTERDKPYAFGRGRQPRPDQWERYLEFMFGQVRELLTNYGKIDVIWFDGAWERTPAQWRAGELAAMVRSLQPHILINDRLPPGQPGAAAGDFDTPEQFVPARPPGRPWEVCLTINESWGYNPADTAYKSGRRLVHTLCEIAGKGGRLLLNVSPMGDGRLPPELMERLAAIERWMGRNGEAISGSEPALEPWQFYGPATQRTIRRPTDPGPDGGPGQHSLLYLHLLMRPYDAVTVRGVRTKRVQAVRVLGTGAPLRFETRCTVIDTLFNADPLGDLIIAVPEAVLDPDATVLAVEFSGPSV